MPSDVDELTAIYRRVHEELAARAVGMSGADARAQSYCTEWSVADVLSHLGSGAVIGLATLRAVVTGEELPGQDFNQPVWDEWNAKSPEAKVAGFVTADGDLLAEWEGLSDEARAAINVERFGMKLDAAGLLLMRLSEVVYHAWDVAVTFDPDARLASDAVPWMLDRIPRMAAYTAHPDDDTKGKVFEVDTTDPAARFTLDLGEPITVTRREAGARPAADAVLPAEALLRLTFGRLDPATTPAEAQVSDDLLAVFAPRPT